MSVFTYIDGAPGFVCFDFGYVSKSLYTQEAYLHCISTAKLSGYFYI